MQELTVREEQDLILRRDVKHAATSEALERVSVLLEAVVRQCRMATVNFGREHYMARYMDHDARKFAKEQVSNLLQAIGEQLNFSELVAMADENDVIADSEMIVDDVRQEVLKAIELVQEDLCQTAKP